MASTDGNQHTLIVQLREEANEAAEQTGQALVSFAWLWPIRGIFFSVTHPHVILSVKETLLKSFVTSSIAFVLLATFTYVPQAAFLSLFTGFLGPFLALLLVGAESIVLLSFFTRALFLEPALNQLFDATLVARGQSKLVKNAKVKRSGSISGRRTSGIENALVRPFQNLSRDGLIKYVLTLPLNIIPVIGNIAFFVLNGHRGGPGWHARYFQLKGFDKSKKSQFVKKLQPEYTAFGMTALLLNTVPLAGLLFTFTSTVGAALWAADIEARANLIEGGSDLSRSKSD